MVITWLGQACFKIQSGDQVVVIDPFSKEIGLTPPRFKSDVVLALAIIHHLILTQRQTFDTVARVLNSLSISNHISGRQPAYGLDCVFMS